MSIKQTIKRGAVKAHRKILGKPTEVMISTGKGGLTKSEIKDVLQTLSNARKQELLPDLTFQYRSPIPILSNREPLFIIPKDGNVLRARVKIREIINARYGGQFAVDGSKANPSLSVKDTRKPLRLSGRKAPRITPKRPKLRR